MNKKREKKIKKYTSYEKRITISVICFVILLVLGSVVLTKTINNKKQTVVSYQERGSYDYKVYLKPNDFYENTYLEKNMMYIASLIKAVDVDINYSFVIDKIIDFDMEYEVVGKINIYDEDGTSLLYEKEYPLIESKTINQNRTKEVSIKENVVIDYDTYNRLANEFRSTYGLDTTSNLTVYLKINKRAKDQGRELEIEKTNEMNLVIPLSQKTINIGMNDTSINNNQSIQEKKDMNVKQIFLLTASFIMIAGTTTIGLDLIDLLMLLRVKKTKYDKYIEKLLREYDRLIVETETTPELENKEIIKIKKFEELLDARDNLKRPIMYHNLIKHHKSYFYIEQGEKIYLLTLKTSDFEGQNEKRKNH